VGGGITEKSPAMRFADAMREINVTNEVDGYWFRVNRVYDYITMVLWDGDYLPSWEMDDYTNFEGDFEAWARSKIKELKDLQKLRGTEEVYLEFDELHDISE
jgi:hypothetical protein